MTDGIEPFFVILKIVKREKGKIGAPGKLTIWIRRISVPTTLTLGRKRR